MVEIKNAKRLPQFVFGNFSKRALAYLIDILIISSVSSLVLKIYRIFGFYDSGTNFGLFNLTSIVFYLVYFTLLTKLTSGQTLGKMVLGLRVISLNGSELSWGDVLTRELIGRYIQKKVMVLYLIVFFTKRRETLADLFTDTVVISEKDYQDLQEFLKE